MDDQLTATALHFAYLSSASSASETGHLEVTMPQLMEWSVARKIEKSRRVGGKDVQDHARWLIWFLSKSPKRKLYGPFLKDG